MRVDDIGTRLSEDPLQRRDHARIRYGRMERDRGPLIPASQGATGPAVYSLDPQPVHYLIRRSGGEMGGCDRDLVTALDKPKRQRLDVLLHAAYERLEKIGNL